MANSQPSPSVLISPLWVSGLISLQTSYLLLQKWAFQCCVKHGAQNIHSFMARQNSRDRKYQRGDPYCITWNAYVNFHNVFEQIILKNTGYTKLMFLHASQSSIYINSTPQSLDHVFTAVQQPSTPSEQHHTTTSEPSEVSRAWSFLPSCLGRPYSGCRPFAELSCPVWSKGLWLSRCWLPPSVSYRSCCGPVDPAPTACRGCWKPAESLYR